jgi:hypothetical protein
MASPCCILAMHGGNPEFWGNPRIVSATPSVRTGARTGSALTNRGNTLGQSGRNKEEIAVMKNNKYSIGWPSQDQDATAADDDAIERCGTAGMPLSPEQAGAALLDNGVRLSQSGRSEEAIAVYQDVVRRFRTAATPALRKLVAQALFNESLMLGQLGRTGAKRRSRSMTKSSGGLGRRANHWSGSGSRRRLSARASFSPGWGATRRLSPLMTK